MRGGGTLNGTLVDNCAKMHHIVVERIFPDGFVLCQRAAVVDGLVGEEQQAGYVGSVALNSSTKVGYNSRKALSKR